MHTVKNTFTYHFVFCGNCAKINRSVPSATCCARTPGVSDVFFGVIVAL